MSNGSDITRAAAAATEMNDVERLKAGIESTQANLAETVAELQRKLSPGHAVERAKASARDTARQLGETSKVAAQQALARADEWRSVAGERATVMGRQAKARLDENPAPLVLVGAGVAAILWHVTRRQVRAARTRAECEY